MSTIRVRADSDCSLSGGARLRVGVIAQPDWRSPDDILRMGRPRLYVGISAGNLDSMLNKLTAQKKVRSEDQYSPGGRTNCRPNRATVVYANLCRQAFPGVPVVLGGIEASLRRIAHYDYWSDSVRRSILLDAKADLLVFGWANAPRGNRTPPRAVKRSRVCVTSAHRARVEPPRSGVRWRRRESLRH